MAWTLATSFTFMLISEVKWAALRSPETAQPKRPIAPSAVAEASTLRRPGMSTRTYVEGFAWLATLGAPVSFRASDTLALAEACVAGLGLAVLPCSVGDAAPSLEAIACAGLCIEPIWMVVPQDLRQRLAVRLTLQWIARLFAEHRPPLSGGEASAAAPVA